MNRLIQRYYSAGARTFAARNKNPCEQELNHFLGDRRKISAQEWGELRSNLLKQVTNHPRLDNIILTHLMEMQSRSVALAYTKQYVNALLALNVQPTLTNYDCLVRSYCRKGSEERLTREEQNELLEACEVIMKKSEMCLPTAMITNIVHGLCQTDQWKRSLSILHEMDESSRIAKNLVAEKAFSTGEIDLGFQLLDEACTDGCEIEPKVCTAYWRWCRADRENASANVERMLRYLESKQVVLTRSCVEMLHDVLNESGCSGHFTEICQSGKCVKCENVLESEGISVEEFKRLKEAVMEIALIGNNTFLKSTPDEVSKFMRFIEKTAPYDVVLDGLNIAFRTHETATKKKKAETLASVVMHFARQEQRVLVIGREHMNGWPSKEMNYIRKNSAFFAVENTSQDDLFTLFAALYSGPNTRTFTCDLMRSHSFILGSELKSIFKRWQQTTHSQVLHVKPNGNIHVSQPTKHKLCCNKSCGQWHVPFMNDEDFQTRMNERTRIEKMQWSCIRLQDKKCTDSSVGSKKR